MLSVSVVVDVVFVVVITFDGYVFADLLLLSLLLSLCGMCLKCCHRLCLCCRYLWCPCFSNCCFCSFSVTVLGGISIVFIVPFVIFFVVIGFLLLLYFSSSLYAQILILNASVDENCFLWNFYEKLADPYFCCCCHFEFKIAS